MSTSAGLILHVHKEDIGKELIFNPTLFEENNIPMSVTIPKSLDRIKPIKIEQEYLYIHEHWDGYIDCVGQILINSFNSYDLVLNLMLGGDISYLDSCYYPYFAFPREEDFNDLMPRQYDKLKKALESNYEDFFYLFDKDKWTYSTLNNETRLTSLKKAVDLNK